MCVSALVCCVLCRRDASDSTPFGLYQPILKDTLAKEMVRDGIDLRIGVAHKVEKKEDGTLFLHVPQADGSMEVVGPFDKVLVAIGRDPSALCSATFVVVPFGCQP